MNAKHALFFEGEFNNNKRDGYGRAIFKNGNMYEGEWDKWNMSGWGKVYFYSGNFKGKTMKGIFYMNKCVKKCEWGVGNYE